MLARRPGVFWRGGVHPIRRRAPVRSQCTRWVAMHPLGRNAPDRKGCIAYRSGAAHTDRVYRHRQQARSRDRARGACRLVCVWGGLEVGGDSVGVGGCELDVVEPLHTRVLGLPSQEWEGRNRDRGDAWGQRRYAATTQLPEAAADGQVSALVTSLSTPRSNVRRARNHWGVGPVKDPLKGAHNAPDRRRSHRRPGLAWMLCVPAPELRRACHLENLPLPSGRLTRP